MNIYIGLWTLRVKCIQYGICGQVAFKNARAMIFFEIGRAGRQQFSVGSRKFWFSEGAGLTSSGMMSVANLSPLHAAQKLRIFTCHLGSLTRREVYSLQIRRFHRLKSTCLKISEGSAGERENETKTEGHRERLLQRELQLWRPRIRCLRRLHHHLLWLRLLLIQHRTCRRSLSHCCHYWTRFTARVRYPARLARCLRLRFWRELSSLPRLRLRV